MIYSGYTPRYNDQRILPHLRAKLNRQIEKAALGAEKLVVQESLEGDKATVGDTDARLGGEETYSDDCVHLKEDATARPEDDTTARSGVDTRLLLTFLEKCGIMEGYALVGLENNLAADEQPRQVILGQKMTAGGTEVKLGEKIVLVLGEEVHGIPAEIRAKLEYFLEIPMCGQKESFNVSVATGIALWGLENLY